VQKQDILKLLEGINDNFMISRSTVFGHYNVSLTEAANLIIDSNNDIEISDFVERLVGVFQIEELMAKYNLNDNQFISNIQSQSNIYNLDSDIKALNSFAKNYIIENNLENELQSRMIEALNLSRDYNMKLKEKKKNKLTTGYIYLIKSELGYKIGKTKNIDQRDKIFSVKMPFDYEYEDFKICNNYHQLELELHKEFEQKKINGEWFQLNSEEVNRVKEVLNKHEVKSSS